jgi:hypothetical protein
MQISMLSVCLCICVSRFLYICISPYQLLKVWANFYVPWYVYHGTWTHLKGVLNNFLPTVCVSIYIYIPVSLPGNGSVETLLQQRTHTQQQNNSSTRSFLWSPCHIKESKILVRLVASCLNICGALFYQLLLKRLSKRVPGMRRHLQFKSRRVEETHPCHFAAFASPSRPFL